MYTQCPECLTVYEIDDDALQASLGIVYCGRCQKRFDALRTLSDTLPLDPFVPLSELGPPERAPTLTVEVPPSTVEQAARRRHPRDDTSTTAQTGSSLRPSTSNDSLTSSYDNADDWFADFESELVASSNTGTPETSRQSVDEGAWAIELPDEASVTGADIGSVSRTDSGDGDLATPPDAEADDSPKTPGAEPSQEFAAAAIDLAGADASDTNAPASPKPATVDEDPDHAAPHPEIVESIHTEPATEDGRDALATDTQAESAPHENEPDTTTVPAHTYVRPNARRFSRVGVAWAIGCAVLALVLAAQLAWARRVALLRNPATHSWVTSVCQTISCRLPPIKDTAKIELLSRDVRPDPNVAGALMITATLRNDAAFRQPWPVVVVELTNLDNRPVAMRRFRPPEYMPNAAKRAAGIAPGATAAVAFEVADPGKSAVAFQFGFE